MISHKAKTCSREKTDKTDFECDDCCNTHRGPSCNLCHGAYWNMLRYVRDTDTSCKLITTAKDCCNWQPAVIWLYCTWSMDFQHPACCNWNQSSFCR